MVRQSHPGPAIEVPGFFDPPDLQDSKLDIIDRTSAKIVSLAERPRARISLFFEMVSDQAIHSTDIDAWLEHWIARQAFADGYSH